MKHTSSDTALSIRWPLGCSLAVGLALSGANAEPARNPSPQPFRITRADPALDSLISPKARLTTVASGFGFADGPVWIRGRKGAPGYLLVSSIIANVVYKVTPAGQVSPFLETAGY